MRTGECRVMSALTGHVGVFCMFLLLCAGCVRPPTEQEAVAPEGLLEAVDSFYAFWTGKTDRLDASCLAEKVWTTRAEGGVAFLPAREYPDNLVRYTEKHFPNFRLRSELAYEMLSRNRRVFVTHRDGWQSHKDWLEPRPSAEAALREYLDVNDPEEYARRVWRIVSRHEAVKKGDRAVLIVNQGGCIGPHVFRKTQQGWQLVLDCDAAFVFPGY